MPDAPPSLPECPTRPHITMDRREELRSIIDQERLTTLFQPIVTTGDCHIHGYEALTRGPSDSPLHSPLALFDAAHREGLLEELEAACWLVACRRFCALDLSGKLFLNITPQSFSGARHLGKELLAVAGEGFARGRVVVELTEQYPVEDYQAILAAARGYRELGFELAIDDLGAGYAGLRLWSELRPDYVKIDAHFLQELHQDAIKQEFVRSIQNIAHGTGCRVVAEGIESEAEHEIVTTLGLALGQGYHFCKPTAQPPAVLSMRLQRSRNGDTSYRLSETIGNLARGVPSVTPETRVESVVERFSTDPELLALPVVSEGRPVGVVRRAHIMTLLLNRYGRELNGKKPIRRFMDQQPLVVEHDLPVERVSQKLTEHLHFEADQGFVITRHGVYLGMGRVRDLLKKITDLQIRNARYANPLTLLPGNVPIHEHIDQLLEEGRSFTVCYCDLDNFKPFNDVYGYSLGDEVIRRLAQVLSAQVDSGRDFVGHIGGDDFILVFRSADWQLRCEAVLRQFAREVEPLYSDHDRRHGGIWAQDRSGQPVFYPLLSLSIGAVTPDPLLCRSHHEVAALASEAKREAKRRPGNSLFTDRRRSAPDHPLLSRTDHAAA